MRRNLITTCLLLIAWGQTLPVSGQRADRGSAAVPEAVSYSRQIRPILQMHCYGCHQQAKASGGYDMTSFAGLLAGGNSKLPAIVPGKVGESHLLRLITGDDNAPAVMPRGKPPLPAEQVRLISRWITQGAKNDSPADQVGSRAGPPPRYAAPPVIAALAYSPDGNLLAVGGYHEILLHRADGSELVARLGGISQRIESLAFSPTGTRLAATGGCPGRFGELQIWNVAKQALELSVVVTHDTLFGAAWSGDGKLVSFGATDDAVRAVDSRTGEQKLLSRAHADWVLDTVFSCDGSHLVSVSRDRTMKLIEVETERLVDNITAHTAGSQIGGIATVDRHPTLDRLLTGGADGRPTTYLMHRSKDRKENEEYQTLLDYGAMPGRVCAVAYSPDGKRFAAGGSNHRSGLVRVYEVGAADPLWQFETSPIYAVVYSPDGRRVATAGLDGHVRLFDASSGKLRADFVPVPLSPKRDAEKIRSENRHEK